MRKFYLIDKNCYDSNPTGCKFRLKSELKFSKELNFVIQTNESSYWLRDNDGGESYIMTCRKMKDQNVKELYKLPDVDHVVQGIYLGKGKMGCVNGIKSVEVTPYFIYVSDVDYEGNVKTIWKPSTHNKEFKYPKDV